VEARGGHPGQRLLRSRRGPVVRPRHPQRPPSRVVAPTAHVLAVAGPRCLY
jgi:hypothetical protein